MTVFLVRAKNVIKIKFARLILVPGVSKKYSKINRPTNNVRKVNTLTIYFGGASERLVLLTGSFIRANRFEIFNGARLDHVKLCVKKLIGFAIKIIRLTCAIFLSKEIQIRDLVNNEFKSKWSHRKRDYDHV